MSLHLQLLTDMRSDTVPLTELQRDALVLDLALRWHTP